MRYISFYKKVILFLLLTILINSSSFTWGKTTQYSFHPDVTAYKKENYVGLIQSQEDIDNINKLLKMNILVRNQHLIKKGNYFEFNGEGLSILRSAAFSKLKQCNKIIKTKIYGISFSYTHLAYYEPIELDRIDSKEELNSVLNSLDLFFGFKHRMRIGAYVADTHKVDKSKYKYHFINHQEYTKFTPLKEKK